MIDIIECPVCKNTDLQFLTRCTDYTVSHETFEIRQCTNCTLAITTPRPDLNKLGSYYKSEEYVSHSGKTSGGIGFVYKIARGFTLGWKKNLINSYKTSGSILDFGCGTGEFLNTMRQSGWSTAGVEPSEVARAKAEVLTNHKISATLQGTDTYDVITAWHVIEHVADLTETLSKLKSLLKKDGIIFIAVPNFQSPDGNQYKETWAGYDVPRHLWHFSKKSMDKLLTSLGLKFAGLVPMKLDAYYVSLLSEKYKNKNTLTFSCLINAVISGLKSNLMARRDTNHSSLIYIAKGNEI